jgi:5-methylcytosine-specific restriction endonuclease McrA
VQRAIDEEGLSMRAAMARFGFSVETWRQAIKRGDIVPRSHLIPIEQLLVAGREKTSRTHLKLRLLAEGLKENRCERCRLVEWRGKPLSIELHHINGDGKDNRLENLEFLCPNCHSQTDTWGGRNGHRRRRREG